jgi:hypothetical protein
LRFIEVDLEVGFRLATGFLVLLLFTSVFFFFLNNLEIKRKAPAEVIAMPDLNKIAEIFMIYFSYLNSINIPVYFNDGTMKNFYR